MFKTLRVLPTLMIAVAGFAAQAQNYPNKARARDRTRCPTKKWLTTR